jgi:hypothetical protein
MGLLIPYRRNGSGVESTLARPDLAVGASLYLGRFRLTSYDV